MALLFLLSFLNRLGIETMNILQMLYQILTFVIYNKIESEVGIQNQQDDTCKQNYFIFEYK